MISFTDKGLGLFRYIQSKGHRLYNVNGEWKSSNDEIVQQLIDEYVPYQPFGLSNFFKLMLEDRNFNQVFTKAQSITPLVAASLPATLSDVESFNFESFELVYSSVVRLGEGTTNMSRQWGDLAAAIGLPQRFVTLIKKYPLG